MLVLFRPFRVGDSIETAGVAGTVTEISLFQTEIKTADNIRIVIPNNAVWSGVTKNLSSYRTRRTDLDIPIPFAMDFGAAVKAVTELVHADPRILKEPAPVVGVSKFSDATARLSVQVWTTTADAGAVQMELSTAVWDQLNKAWRPKPSP
jgi:small conductance mechanosensitive channel